MFAETQLSLKEIDSQAEKIRKGKALPGVVSYPWRVELFEVTLAAERREGPERRSPHLSDGPATPRGKEMNAMVWDRGTLEFDVCSPAPAQVSLKLPWCSRVERRMF